MSKRVGAGVPVEKPRVWELVSKVSSWTLVRIYDQEGEVQELRKWRPDMN